MFGVKGEMIPVLKDMSSGEMYSFECEMQLLCTQAYGIKVHDFQQKKLGSARQMAEQLAAKYGVSVDDLVRHPKWGFYPQTPIKDALATKITFGKHAGKTLAEIDTDYIRWLVKEQTTAAKPWVPAAVVALAYKVRVEQCADEGIEDVHAHIVAQDPDLWASLGIADL